MSVTVDARSLPIPRTWPVGGNMIDFARDPIGFMMRLCAQASPEEAPVQHFVLTGLNAYLIRDVEMIHDILVTHASLFQKGRTLEEAKRLLGDGLLTSEGQVHRRHRRLMQPSFTPRHIANYADTMIRLAESATARWQHGQTISTTHEMMQLTLAVITQTMFGFDAAANLERVEDNINLVIQSVAPSLRKLLPPFLQGDGKVSFAIDALNTAIHDIISSRRVQNAADDTNLLALLMAARDEGGGSGLTDEELRNEVMTIYMAGHETTANLLAWHLLGAVRESGGGAKAASGTGCGTRWPYRYICRPASVAIYPVCGEGELAASSAGVNHWTCRYGGHHAGRLRVPCG